MHSNDFEQVVEAIIAKDKTYPAHAYHFVRRALTYTTKIIQAQNQQSVEKKQVKARELLAGLKDFAIEEYGPMAWYMLQQWNIKKTDDIGRIVFHLVDGGVLTKTQDDAADEFQDVFDLEEALVQPFAPQYTKVKISTRRTKKTRPATSDDALAS